MIHAALKALVARRRRAGVDAAYEAYDRHPLDEPDEWGDLASFYAANSQQKAEPAAEARRAMRATAKKSKESAGASTQPGECCGSSARQPRKILGRRTGGGMVRPTRVESRGGYRIWLEYSDGTAGELDLSYLAGRGVFKVWEGTARFETVHIGPAGGIAWGDDVELCPDDLYMRLTGRPLLAATPAHRA